MQLASSTCVVTQESWSGAHKQSSSLTRHLYLFLIIKRTAQHSRDGWTEQSAGVCDEADWREIYQGLPRLLQYVSPSASAPSHRLLCSLLCSGAVAVAKDNKLISPFHDVPLWADKEKGIANFVCEIPRGERAKLEIIKDQFLNPIVQDTKKGKLRFVHWRYPFNYGAFPQVCIRSAFCSIALLRRIPSSSGASPASTSLCRLSLCLQLSNVAMFAFWRAQTWEDPNEKDPHTGELGDSDPIDVCEIGDTYHQTGDIIQVKVLGCTSNILLLLFLLNALQPSSLVGERRRFAQLGL